jgi:L-ascorbate metabolism protein UlaG (beta-lactamase superfamily)
MKVTYYGHSCYQLEINGEKILLDPFITPNELAKKIDINSIKPDYIFVSHGHEDHVADVESIAKRTGAKLVSSFEVVNWFTKKGVENAHSMGIGGS